MDPGPWSRSPVLDMESFCLFVRQLLAPSGSSLSVCFLYCCKIRTPHLKIRNLPSRQSSPRFKGARAWLGHILGSMLYPLCLVLCDSMKTLGREFLCLLTSAGLSEVLSVVPSVVNVYTMLCRWPSIGDLC